ncbi:MAG: HU family DNA-binding protein [Paludibacteraceae bacterium]|nr:HU family DNA-binding protein [Paludibacteraceae bacterium]
MKSLVDVFASKAKITKKEANAFVKAFQNIFIDALSKDKVLKITGLGSFKVTLVNERSSIDINTGKPIKINSHYKIVFTPDSELKNIVNSPFAHLDTIIIDDVVDMSDGEVNIDTLSQDLKNLSANHTVSSVPPVDEVKTDVQLIKTDNEADKVESPLEKLAEQALEIKSLLADIQGLSSDGQDTKTDVIPNPDINSESEIYPDTLVNSEKKITHEIEIYPDTEKDSQTETSEKESVISETENTAQEDIMSDVEIVSKPENSAEEELVSETDNITNDEIESEAENVSETENSAKEETQLDAEKKLGLERETESKTTLEGENNPILEKEPEVGKTSECENVNNSSELKEEKNKSNSPDAEMLLAIRKEYQRKRRSRVAIILSILAIVLILASALALDFYYNGFVKQRFDTIIAMNKTSDDDVNDIDKTDKLHHDNDNNVQESVVLTNDTSVEIVDTVQYNEQDTAFDDAPDTKAETSIEQTDIFNTPRVYTRFLDTIQMPKDSRLTLISLKYYGHRDFWVYIYEANQSRIPNPNVIVPGTTLYIPKVNGALIDSSNPQAIKYARELHDKFVKKAE